MALITTHMEPEYFLKKAAKLLLLAKNTEKIHYLSSLSKDTGITYPYTVSIVKGLSADGFLATRKEGKKVIVSLTEKGVAAATAIESFISAIKPKPTQEVKPKTAPEAPSSPQSP